MWRPRVPGESERWPSRVEAFTTACAVFAGQRENDLMNIVEGLGAGLEQAAKRRG